MEKSIGDDAHRPEVRHDDLIVGQPAAERLLDVADEVKDVDRIDELALEERRVGVDADALLLEQPAPDEVEEPLVVWIRHGVPTWTSGNPPLRARSIRGYPAPAWGR